MNSQRYSRIDLVGVVVIVVVLVAVAIPVIGQARRSSRIELCATNLAWIGAAAKFYAIDNREAWPNPPFSNLAWREGAGIDYQNNDGTTMPPNLDPGEVGYERDVETRSDKLQILDGSLAVSTTRAFWLLVRSRDIRIEHFICPSSHDRPDPTLDAFSYDYLLDQYYDFTAYENISYGYQVPFGPRDSRPREVADSRQVFAADKGPFYTDAFEPSFLGPRREPLAPDGPKGKWRRYNSPNHHGQGQNVLLADGHVAFDDRPTAGVHGDNIYTLMTDEWDGTVFNRIHGESPHYSVYAYPFPGQGALDRVAGIDASTDTLIYS